MTETEPLGLLDALAADGANTRIVCASAKLLRAHQHHRRRTLEILSIRCPESHRRHLRRVEAVVEVAPRAQYSLLSQDTRERRKLNEEKHFFFSFRFVSYCPPLPSLDEQNRRDKLSRAQFRFLSSRCAGCDGGERDSCEA